MANFACLKQCKLLLRPTSSTKICKGYLSSKGAFAKLSKTTVALVVGGTAVTTVGLAAALQASVKAFGLDLTPPHYPWSHKGVFDSFDHASIRRGYQVYKQVCAACHSMQFIHYRDLVGVCMTEEEAKKEAAEAMITDGPGDDGEMYERPGKLTDVLPPPYKNQQAAMAANNGAYPPDLSLITLARHHEEDYIFSLLTGYCDPPAGMDPMEDLHYNPYFSGSWIAMAEALYNEIIEYEDGTPATQSQLAKDVSTFLRWAAEPEFDTRKRYFIKAFPIVLLGMASTIYYRRSKSIVLRSRVTQFLPGKK